jgi:hypothetical protein
MWLRADIRGWSEPRPASAEADLARKGPKTSFKVSKFQGFKDFCFETMKHSKL